MYLVDAFTSHPFEGNTAGVITTADMLSISTMQMIARELRQTETCFVSSSFLPNTDIHLRWFTPTVEVDRCGHATIAAMICLAYEDRVEWDQGEARLRCGTRNGTVEVVMTDVPGGAPHITLSTGVPQICHALDDRVAIANAVGLAPHSIDPDLPLGFDSASARVIVPVKDLADLLAMVPSGASMISYGERTTYRRYTLFCRETHDPQCAMHIRHFAPANGIAEDPVTGTAHAATAAYLEWQGLLPTGDSVVLLGEQGHAVRRPGLVGIEVLRHEGLAVDIRIDGSGVITANGTLRSL